LTTSGRISYHSHNTRRNSSFTSNNTALNHIVTRHTKWRKNLCNRMCTRNIWGSTAGEWHRNHHQKNDNSLPGETWSNGQQLPTLTPSQLHTSACGSTSDQSQPFQRYLILNMHGLVADDSSKLMQWHGLGQQKLGQHAGALVCTMELAWASGT